MSEWSDFSTRRHIPDLGAASEAEPDADVSDLIDVHGSDPSGQLPEPEDQDEEEDEDYPPKTRTVFVPIPPEDYEPPTRPYRDPLRGGLTTAYPS